MAIFFMCVRRKLRMKCVRILIPLVPALVLLVLAFPHALAPVIRSDLQDLQAPDSQEADPHVTLLLVWWSPFGNTHPLPDCATSYGVPGCALTIDRSEYAHADAVILHHRELVTKEDALPPSTRPEGQKWIWMNFESPSHSPWLDSLNGVFNLTMSYRLGSDIFLPYGYLRRHHHGNGDVNHFPKKLQGRRHGNNNDQRDNNDTRALVAWVISNWSEEQERVQFYMKLRRYLHVDVYGRRALRLVNDSVLQTISGYKFYLAFENSLHTDYITEKLWRNALQAGAVPVVLGPPRENYERFLPPDAFIHVHDFKSPRALASYLNYLDHHPAQYRRYMAWRRDYSVHVASFWAEHYCTACQAVQASRNQRKTIKNLDFWFQN
ncbi:alpha-(1,3)-fucosyltransferase 4-like [Hoplias malabaricus]|uniref:alpha-(1,3)-fucosyltransferase 4-like n=1 Tax=Hoplias malabaricus TaxID=27720 RepID=UPI0034629CAE